jgi:putative endopeptidase
MGENIADLAGLAIAYKAYHIALASQTPKTLDGFAGDQRFYLSYAQVWRTKIRDGSLRAQVLSDPHSPSEYRVDGITRNLDSWYEAFGVTPGAAYYMPPDHRVRLW